MGFFFFYRGEVDYWDVKGFWLLSFVVCLFGIIGYKFDVIFYFFRNGRKLFVS